MRPATRAIRNLERLLANLEDEETDQWYGPYIEWLQHRQDRYRKALIKVEQLNNKE